MDIEAQVDAIGSEVSRLELSHAEIEADDNGVIHITVVNADLEHILLVDSRSNAQTPRLCIHMHGNSCHNVPPSHSRLLAVPGFD